MASRYELEISITAAKDLKNVNWRHGKLKPYAVVWIDPKSKCSSHVDDEGDTSPHWNEKLTIPFDSPIEESTLFIEIVHAGAAEDTKPLIGSAKLPLRDVVDDVGLGSRAEKKLDLKRPSGRPQGKLEIEVIVRDPRYRVPDPHQAPPYGVPLPGTRDYPAPAPYASPYGAPAPYAAPPSGYPGYGAAHPPTAAYQPYGAPPAAYSQGGYYGQPAYGQGGHYGQPAYGQTGYVEEKKKKGGMGMGTGLAVGAAAGLLGGLAIAEGVDALEDHIADDVAERVEDDLGYDDGDF